jgi:hypothetical protein
MSELDKLMAAAHGIQAVRMPGEAEWELKTLRAIETWAKDTLPFKVGDRVKLRDGYTVPPSSHGWLPYAKDVLFPGSVGTVKAVDFNAHYGAWQFDVEFDVYAGRFAHAASSLVPA